MIEKAEIKRLDNYQLFKLINQKSLDKLLLLKLKQAYEARDISSAEQSRLQNKYITETASFYDDEVVWNPIFTGFALKRHFAHLAKLQVQGKKQEFKIYQRRLYLGISIYFIAFISLILLLTQ